ncbi:RNA-directed DNA polymerase, eukaryota, reverse transcriptase zinc-binding domain protein [Tanacetum coccineum]
MRTLWNCMTKKKEELLNNNDAESVVGDDLEQVLNHLDDAHSPNNSVQKQDNGENQVTPKDVRIMWIVVYAPQNLFSKIALWSSLANIIANCNGILGSKMSKLDRFLVSDNFLDVFPFATGVILEKGRPDHRLILLKESVVDYGPTLFRFFNYWLEMDGFHNLVTDKWNNDGDIDRREASDFAQKSRIKWALEGDENSSFFHGSVKRKRRQLAITGILKNGDWIEDPNICDFLEHQCTREEIKKVVWDCGGDRASGPDGFTFNLITSFWDLLEAHVVRFVYDLFLLGTFPKGCNSSFISFIPKIPGCLNNACFSLLVNGYPTFEFELFKGLRQGDPLSPLLFILMMEGLHAITCKSVDLGLFRGVSIGRDSLSISHLMYADDVIFLGEWSQSNIKKLLCMLRCFFLVLGLKINVQKSNISGVSVPAKDVAKMAKILVMKFSSKLVQWKAHHLSVGGRLSLIKSVLGNLPTYYMSIYMMPVSIQKKLESMRNNFFIGGDEGDKKITWVKWKKCLASKKLGGLGIGSIYAINLGLLFKWIWRFRCHSNDLWVRVINDLYGLNGGIHDDRVHPYSTWGAILSSVKRLKQNGTDLLALCVRKIRNGARTCFWNDTWCGNSPLKTIYLRIYMIDSDIDSMVSNRLNVRNWSSIIRRLPRGGVETSQFNALLSSIKDVALSDQIDSLVWSLNASIGYTVASIRSLIDDNSLVVDSNATRWNRSVSIKINVFLWRVALNKLPTGVNLDRKGIDIESTLCPICCEDVETVNHIFFSCEMAKDLWALLARWWELDIPFCSNFLEWSSWLDSSHLPSKAKIFLDGVGGTILWYIWNFRNRLVFSVPPPKKATLWDSIISQSFLWISSRNPKFKFSWVGWIQNLIVSIASM